jgi:LPXTG-motif cell wall-anchored protein
MSWLFLAMVILAGFALLKVRRRRKTRHTGSSYYDSKAA